MTITSYFTTFLLATFLLFTPGALALPTDTADETTVKALEFPTTPLSPYLTALMNAIPNLPNPENATALAASRKIIEDTITAFSRDNKHLLQPGEKEVGSDEHWVCDTTEGSPYFHDAIGAIRKLWERGNGRCIMNHRCTEFVTWGSAAIGACTGGNQMWDFACDNLARWSTTVAWTCLAQVGGALRTGGRQIVSHTSNTDCRIYRN